MAAARLPDGLEQASGIDVRVHADEAGLRAAMREKGLDAPDGQPWAKLVDGLLSQSLEPTLIQPTILHDYPLELSPFAKRRPDDPGIVERFEAFAGGMEIANAFTELNDPDDQRERFRMAAADWRPATTRRSRWTRTSSRRSSTGCRPRAAWGWGSTAW